MPRSRRLPVSSSFTRRMRSLRRMACMCAVTNATSVQIAPMSAMWLQRRSSSRQIVRSARGRDAGGALGGVAEGGGVCETGVTGNTFGQPDAVWNGPALKKFSDAFVDVKHPQLQIEHRLARHAEEKMPGLDDARVDRADRHLENAFAFDLAELMARALERRQHGAQVKILAQRKHFRPVIVQHAAAGVRMSDQLDAE